MRTGRQALSKLLGLVVVLQDEGVEVLRASDLELRLGRLGGLLDPGGYQKKGTVRTHIPRHTPPPTMARTAGVLAPADLDELKSPIVSKIRPRDVS